MKSRWVMAFKTPVASLSARRVWIEITDLLWGQRLWRVTLREEGVD